MVSPVVEHINSGQQDNQLSPFTKNSRKMRLLIVLTFALISQVGLFAQSSDYYTLQVGTFLDAQGKDFDKLRSLGLVHAKPLSGNLMEVYVGGFRDRASAEQALPAVREKGFPNAFVKSYSSGGDQVVTVVQLATRDAAKPIDWASFRRAGEIKAILNGKLIKIVTGPHANSAAAQKALSTARSLGYKDAFVKTTNAKYLHALTPFETGVKEDLIPIAFEQNDMVRIKGGGTAPATAQPQATPSNSGDYMVLETTAPRTPTLSGQPTITPAPPTSAPTSASIPSGYDYYTSGSTGGRIPATATGTSEAFVAPAPVSLPSINGKVKRTSVIELQKLLKAQKVYTSSLDGYYGTGTSDAYEDYLDQNRFMQNYQTRAAHAPLPGDAGSNSALQGVIDGLSSSTYAAAQLANYDAPVAKAYQAYVQFLNYGPSNEVNQLMTAANRAAFTGQSAQSLPYDPNATYAYQDMAQLILHLHYIHASKRTKEAVPCWMAQAHPQETAAAVKASSGFIGQGLKLQNCGQFEAWPEIRMLVMVAADLNDAPQFDQNRLAKASSERARLYGAPTALNNTEQKAVEKWAKNLTTGIYTWGTRDPLQGNLSMTFRVLFYQSQVRLEDYFMQKGYKSSEATGLALATLHTLVAYHTQRFV